MALLTPDEAAAFLKISKSTVYQRRDIPREALRRRERERNAALQVGAPVWWRSMNGVLRGPGVIEAVMQVDGVPWVRVTWDDCIHWVSARLIEDEPPVPPEVTRRSPGPTRPVPDRCEMCAYSKHLVWSVPQEKWTCLICFDPSGA